MDLKTKFYDLKQSLKLTENTLEEKLNDLKSENKKQKTKNERAL